MAGAAAKAEFSRLVDIDRIGEDGLKIMIEANEEERGALARRFGLVALDSLLAEAAVTRAAGGMVRVALDWQAQVVQSCVVTLDPVAARLSERAVLLFAEDAKASPKPGGGEEIEIDPETEDPPDPLVGGAVDLGEAAAEQLALALDPYPRRPGVELPEIGGEAEEGAPEERVTPFSALAKLKEKK